MEIKKEYNNDGVYFLQSMGQFYKSGIIMSH